VYEDSLERDKDAIKIGPSKPSCDDGRWTELPYICIGFIISGDGRLSSTTSLLFIMYLFIIHKFIHLYTPSVFIWHTISQFYTRNVTLNGKTHKCKKECIETCCIERGGKYEQLAGRACKRRDKKHDLDVSSLNLLETSGPVQACNGIALPLPYIQ